MTEELKAYLKAAEQQVTHARRHAHIGPACAEVLHHWEGRLAAYKNVLELLNETSR